MLDRLALKTREARRGCRRAAAGEARHHGRPGDAGRLRASACWRRCWSPPATASLAILPLLANRALDGVDGALARLSATSERGAFLDISLDFVFYAAIPLAFGIAAPEPNALAAAVLLAAFVVTGTSFLAFAVIAEKRGLKSAQPTRPRPSTISAASPRARRRSPASSPCACGREHFAALAYFYAMLCALTSATRLHAGWKAFG